MAAANLGGGARMILRGLGTLVGHNGTVAARDAARAKTQKRVKVQRDLGNKVDNLKALKGYAAKLDDLHAKLEVVKTFSADEMNTPAYREALTALRGSLESLFSDKTKLPEYLQKSKHECEQDGDKQLIGTLLLLRVEGIPEAKAKAPDEVPQLERTAEAYEIALSNNLTGSFRSTVNARVTELSGELSRQHIPTAEQLHVAPEVIQAARDVLQAGSEGEASAIVFSVPAGLRITPAKIPVPADASKTIIVARQAEEAARHGRATEDHT
ncbi:MAG: hypothetical protein ABIE84_06785 [bacterium]